MKLYLAPCYTDPYIHHCCRGWLFSPRVLKKLRLKCHYYFRICSHCLLVSFGLFCFLVNFYLHRMYHFIITLQDLKKLRKSQWDSLSNNLPISFAYLLSIIYLKQNKETDMLSIRGTGWIPYEFNLYVDPHHEIKLFTLGEKCISKASLWKADPQTLSPCSYLLRVSECLAHKRFLLSLGLCSMCCLSWNLSVIVCHLNKA